MGDSAFIKVEKSWVAKVIGALIAALCTGIVTWGGVYWTWEHSQVTKTELVEKLNVFDHGTVLDPKETAQPPVEGMAKALQVCRSESILLKTDLGLLSDQYLQLEKENSDQYEWLVRSTAAIGEADPRKRSRAGQMAVTRFREKIREGWTALEASRAALETNPYDLH